MIKVNNLSKIYNEGKKNETIANNNMTLELEDNGLYVIFGKSGAGKTTFMNALGGLDSFNDGSISFDSESFNKKVSDEYRIDNIGYIFQNYCLEVKENVYENVALGLRTIGVKDEEVIFNRVMTALANVGMSKTFKRDVTTLSGGEQQRVSIARAMAKGSKIILADEPTGNLDEYNTNVVMNLLKEMSKTRLVILVTHEIDIVEKYADKIIEISDGKIVNQYDGQNQKGSKIENENIYLKDLEYEKEELEEITIDRYGDKEPLDLKIISKDGKIYIMSYNQNVKYVDKNSEIKVLNTTREEYFSNKEEESSIHVKELKAISPQKDKRVFGFKESFAKAGAGSKKFIINNVFLNIIVIGLMIGIIILSGVWGLALYKYNQNITRVEGEYLTILIDLDNYDKTNEILNKYGEDLYYRFKPGSYVYEEFRPNLINLSSSETIVACNFPAFNYDIYDGEGYSTDRTNARILERKYLKDNEVVCGAIKEDKIIVTTGFADAILKVRSENKKNSVLKNNDYTALLGANIDGNAISAVVKDKVSCVYFTSAQIKKYYHDYNGFSVNVVKEPKVTKDNVIYSREVYEKTTKNIKVDGVDVVIEFVPLDIFKEDNKSSFSKEEKECFFQTDYVATQNTVDLLGDLIYLCAFNTRYIVYLNNTKIHDDLVRELDNSEIKYTSSIKTDEMKKESLHDDIVSTSIVTTCLYVGLVLVCGGLMFVNMLERKKEIGVYKAIGVTNKDIRFKYFVESLRNIVIPVFIAILLVGLLVMLIPSRVFMYNWWQFLINLIVPPCALIGINLLALNRFTRKTASKILTDFDI